HRWPEGRHPPLTSSAMQRHTKIIATLGPATDDPDTLKALIGAGVDMVRLNFSHVEAVGLLLLTVLVRKTATVAGCDVDILADLQGHIIRIGGISNSSVQLQPDKQFTLDTELADDAGDSDQVSVTYPQLPRDVDSGDYLMLDDGRLTLKV